MKEKTILIAVIALLVGGIGGYAISRTTYYDSMMGRHWDNDRYEDKNKAPERETFSSDMHGMHNMNILTEKEFLAGMIPHHQEAVDTAKQVVARGETDETKKLASDIITAQEKEIADMKSWYKIWYSEDYKDDGSYKPMMRDLTALSGKELDKAFLEDMIMHHMGALMMAQQVAQRVEHTEIQTLTEAIAKTQSAEIIDMRILLKQY
ncbi:MAG: hypothetical protein RL538_878 [Candidatus Parcubacteria bacterium]|jgi:uncharacterized protein (DUF305 family)